MAKEAIMEITLNITRSIAAELNDDTTANDESAIHAELVDRIFYAFGTTKKQSIEFAADAKEWSAVCDELRDKADLLLSVADDEQQYDRNEARRLRQLCNRITEWTQNAERIFNFTK
jgi:hypothetical protein